MEDNTDNTIKWTNTGVAGMITVVLAAAVFRTGPLPFAVDFALFLLALSLTLVTSLSLNRLQAQFLRSQEQWQRSFPGARDHSEAEATAQQWARDQETAQLGRPGAHIGKVLAFLARTGSLERSEQFVANGQNSSFGFNLRLLLLGLFGLGLFRLLDNAATASSFPTPEVLRTSQNSFILLAVLGFVGALTLARETRLRQLVTRFCQGEVLGSFTSPRGVAELLADQTSRLEGQLIEISRNMGQQSSTLDQLVAVQTSLAAQQTKDWNILKNQLQQLDQRVEILGSQQEKYQVINKNAVQEQHTQSLTQQHQSQERLAQLIVVQTGELERVRQELRQALVELDAKRETHWQAAMVNLETMQGRQVDTMAESSVRAGELIREALLETDPRAQLTAFMAEFTAETRAGRSEMSKLLERLHENLLGLAERLRASAELLSLYVSQGGVADVALLHRACSDLSGSVAEIRKGLDSVGETVVGFNGAAKALHHLPEIIGEVKRANQLVDHSGERLDKITEHFDKVMSALRATITELEDAFARNAEINQGVGKSMDKMSLEISGLGGVIPSIQVALMGIGRSLSTLEQINKKLAMQAGFG